MEEFYRLVLGVVIKDVEGAEEFNIEDSSMMKQNGTQRAFSVLGF